MRTPEVGAPAYDARRARYGRVMQQVASRVYLRPVGGGPEWEARAEDVRPARMSEALHDPVAEANARSRGEIL